MCRLLFLPISCTLRPPPPPPGDTCAFARDEGFLAVPTAHASPGTGPVRVASRIPAWRALRAGRVLASCAQPLPTAPHRPRKETHGRGGVSLHPGTPSWERCARGQLCPIHVCASRSVSYVPLCALE